MSDSPIRATDAPRVVEGPGLLSGLGGGPGLAAHRRQYGELPRVGLDDLLGELARLRVRGRGGAGFPFETKLRTVAAGRRPVLVVNLSEGEPASAKDCALATTRPHLVLDGVHTTATALGAREIHLVVPRERPRVRAAVRAALAERPERRVTVHTADARFVAGQARAALELIAGRPNLPVTSWQPEAVAGHRGRPTLLSNAETWAQVGRLVLVGEHRYAALGTTDEPGSTLLTLSGPTPTVVEVPYGTPWRDVLPASWSGRPVLVGGFHGTWVPWPDLVDGTVSVDAMRAAGAPLGAGVLVCPDEPAAAYTTRVVDYLAAQSAGRCGPCRNGLPALASAMRLGDEQRATELAALVTGRGACTHPDGTARLVRSLLALRAEVAS